MAVERRVKKGILRLLRERPFYGSVLLQLNIVEDDSIPTACTNGEHIKYSPTFFQDKDDEFILMVLEHEVLHVVLDHIRRMQNRDPLLWNLATDSVIDIIQKNPDVDKVPSAEEIYRELEKQLEKQKNNESGNGNGENENKDGNSRSNGNSGNSRDNGNERGGGNSNNKRIVPNENNPYGIGGVERNSSLSEEKVKEKIVRAVTIASQMQANKSIGTLPQAIQELLEEYLAPPKVKWQEVLTAYLTEKNQSEFTWSRPSKKSPAGTYLPGKSRKYNGARAVLALDVSGSITNQQLQEFFNECRHILNLYDIEGYVVQFDSEIQHVQELSQDSTPIQFKRYGCGGTDFSDVCNFATKQDDISLLIVFTDLMGTFPTKPPVGVDVLWIVTDNNSPEAPFGRIVKM